jgi:undecaprenyl-diphosphatase
MLTLFNQLLIIIFVALTSLCSVYAEKTFKEDSIETLTWMGKASYLQFTQRNNLYFAAVGVPAVAYAFEYDKRLQARYGGTEIANIVDHVGDAGVVFNFPVLHGAFYWYGKKYGNSHHVQFAKEYFAAMYLALFETGILSYVDVHKRPVVGDESFWEKEFRGDSSWPSGHVIPYMSLTFKTMQFYGAKWAAIPFVFSILSSMQRVQDNKHWVSDVTASFLISAWASEGVRAAAGYNKNHPFYKWAFEHNLTMGFIKNNGVLGPALSFTY